MYPPLLLLLLSLISTFPSSKSQIDFTSATEEVKVRLNKCLYNELGYLREVFIPNSLMGNNISTTFPLQLKCATRLPHCMKPCGTEILRKTIEFTEERVLPFDKYFTASGFLRFGSDFYHPDEFCVLRSSKKYISIEMCRPDCGQTHVCVPKCCSADKVMDFTGSRFSCQYSSTLWEPPVYKTEDLRACGESAKRLHYFQAIPPCPQLQYFFLKAVEGNLEIFRVRFRLLQDGSVVLRELQSKEWKRPPPGHYCLDGLQNFGTEMGPYTGNPLDQVLMICAASEAEEQGNRTDEVDKGGGGQMDQNQTDQASNKMTLSGILYCILLFSGTPFLLITVIVYVLLWGRQNVHGWTLFSHTLAILLNYLGQGITNTVTRLYDSDDNASTSCMLIGILNHYFALASFCWMTMINYDLWSMFRHLKNTVGRSKGMKRFLVYMLLAWGVPTIIVTISVILDLKFGLYGEDEGECGRQITVPLYGHKSCYIVEESRPYYLFYPIGTLMGINIVLGALTAWNMYSHSKGAKIADKKSTKHKRKFAVWSKLFIVMGIALTSELIVWNLKAKNETLPWYLAFPDLLSVFQAIAIFVLFACQPKIIHQLQDAYPKMRPFLKKVLQLPCYNRNRATNGNTRGQGQTTTTPLPVKL